MRLVFGGKDMIEQLEDCIARVRSGELEGVVIIASGVDGFGWSGRAKADMQFAWSRLCAATADASREMLTMPMDEWP